MWKGLNDPEKRTSTLWPKFMSMMSTFGVWHLLNETLIWDDFHETECKAFPYFFHAARSLIVESSLCCTDVSDYLIFHLKFCPVRSSKNFLSLKGLETSTKLVLLPLRCYWEELSLHFHFFWKSASDPANSYTQMFWTVCNYSSNTINKHRKNISKHTISISPSTISMPN